MNQKALILSALLTFWGPSALSANAKTPRVLSVSGDVQFQAAREDSFRPLKVGAALRERALFRTGSASRVSIQVSEGLKVELFPESQMSFPGISWESGAVPEIILQEGRLRWTQSASRTSMIKTPLFEQHPPAGDFVFYLRPKMAQAGVMVFQGEISFKALNAEDAFSVPQGEKIQFNGLMEDGEIAYDILLQGRKIPRGVMGKRELLSPEDLAPFKAEEARLRAAREKAERERRSREAARKQAGLICKNPPGRLNDCAWSCENNPKGAKACAAGQGKTQCVRRRCDANGQWNDAQALAASEGRQRCQAQPVVAACDY